MKMLKNKTLGQTRAFESKNIPKAKAQKAISAIEEYLDNQTNAEDIPVGIWEHLTTAQRYFAPKSVKKAETDDFTWLFSACSTNKDRKILHYIQVKNGIAVASDGRRIHKCPTSKPDGYYHKSGVCLTEAEFEGTIGIYPRWELCIPDESNYIPLFLNNATKHLDGKVWTARPEGWSDCSLDEKYLSDLITNRTGTLLQPPELDDYLGCITYRDGNRYGLLMKRRV